MTDLIDGAINAERMAGWWKRTRTHEDRVRHSQIIRELVFDVDGEAVDEEAALLEIWLGQEWEHLGAMKERGETGTAYDEREYEWVTGLRRFETLTELSQHRIVREVAGLPLSRPVVIEAPPPPPPPAPVPQTQMGMFSAAQEPARKRPSRTAPGRKRR